MDDFDDFIDDDFDEQTLAALDQIEKNLLEKKHESTAVNPPAKRQKLETGWRHLVNNSFDLDELPEISVVQNSYTFQNSPSLTPGRVPNRVQPVATSSRNVPKATAVQKRASFNRNQPGSRQPSVRPRNSRLLEEIASALAEPPNNDPRPPQRFPAPVSARLTQPVLPLPATQPQPTLPAHVVTRHEPTPPPVRQLAPAPAPASPVPPPSPKISEEIDQFKKQLEEIRQENEKIRAALKEAEEARLAKVGEVAVLRRGIQKTAEDHATQISKLKTAKDEADAKQTNLQRDLKEEMERMKTQFIFRQHELESSRKGPMSVARKNVTRELPGATQTPFWGTRAAGPSSSGHLPPEATPIRTLIRPQFRSPEKSRKTAMLPGFENSFLESTPKRILGKEKAISPEIHRPLFADELRNASVPPVRAQSAFPDHGFGMDIDVPPIVEKMSPKNEELPSSPIRPDRGDIEMDDGEEEEEEEEESLDEAHFNWKAELTRVMLTHTHSSYPQPTLQLLAEQSVAIGAPGDYSSHISRILEVIASTAIQDDYERAISVVARCLISLSIALNLSNLILPLIPLLNLLSTLIYSQPSFISTVLHQCEDNNPRILVLLCDVIRQQLDVEKHSDDTPLLAAQALSLAESLCWRTPEDAVEKLDFIARNQEILMVLLNNSQPSWFLARVARLLTLMCKYPHLARSLLSLPVSATNNQAPLAPKIPQLDRLCFFLIDQNRQGAESVTLRENVVTLLAVLSQSHPDAHATLTSTYATISSLVSYLTSLTSPIWEEDESLVSSPSTVASTISSVNQTTYLLHYLVFSVQPEIGLKIKLQNAPQRPFNGVTHMFIVTFGRLSYAPIPEWLDSDKSYELSGIREMARELLELVVDGPDIDNVYAAYHDEEEIDEGEMEKQLLGDA